jgi:hypothetical protein
MEFFRRLKSAFSRGLPAGPAAEAPAPFEPARSSQPSQPPDDMLAAFEREALSAADDANLSLLPAARAILARPRAEWPEFVGAIIRRLKEIDDARLEAGLAYYQDELWRRVRSLNQLTQELLGAPLPFTEAGLATVLDLCAAHVALARDQFPFHLLVQQIKPLAANLPGAGPLVRAVAEFAAAMRSLGQPGITIAEAATRFLARQGALVPGTWADQVLAAAQTESARDAIVHALKAAGKSKPSDRFLKTARALLASEATLTEQVMSWIEAYRPDPQYADPNDEAVRGLIWMLSTTDQASIVPRLGLYGEFCCRKVPGCGARSTKLGNAAIWALAAIGSPHAIAELSRLKTRIRYPLMIERIEVALAELASRLEVSEDELEDMSLPSYELSVDGERRLPVGDGSAIIRIAGTREVTLSFVGTNGREAASPAKALKDAAPDAIALARGLRNQIEAALAGQSSRIEQLYLTGRTIPYEHWQERYLRHPLRAALTQRLIWVFGPARNFVAGLPRGGAIEDLDGRPVTPAPGTAVTLWHPLMAEAEQVLGWRRRLAAFGITQPFKQAHREIYLLTDAERTTAIYSNRFAAHLLRQHQFKALCDQRDWRYQLMGAWDSHNTPTRLVPGRGLVVEFWVNGVEEAENTRAGIYTLVATDQVRFLEGDDVMALEHVPPLLFSELMRDVDLFVGVASVGNDPNWADGGPMGVHQDYWLRYAFGELGQSAKTRAEVLAALLPSLVIADRCELKNRFLVVRGKLRTYKIHLGSANIQMEPNDQYLCIVPGRGGAENSKPAEKLFLPFEGDMTLSVILSKAFLLADDDKISDPTILRQIRA